MKIYKTQKEVETDIINGNLIINGNVRFDCDINIRANITAGNITAGNITARNITARDITARDISYYAFCNAYKNIRCNTINARRQKYAKPQCIDGELIINKKEGT